MYVNGTPFCHFLKGDVVIDLETADDYSIVVDALPFDSCPDYLKKYICSNFENSKILEGMFCKNQPRDVNSLNK